MDTFDVVCTVLAVRAYQPKPVPPETVRRIVESAWLTGSSRNGQPWHFIVVEDHSMLQKLAAVARTGSYIDQAALAVVVAIEDSVYAISDASRAIQSMILTAWSEVVGSNWVGFHNLPGVNALLDIPAEIEVLAIIPFGYPIKRIGKGKKNRKPFGQVVHFGHFSQPFT
jgi:nitroreductase